MKRILFFSFVPLLSACNQQVRENQLLQNKIDSLEIKLAATYKPGFGEFMSGIQAHHAKLWFAGINKNWKLADFELKEIMGSIEDIKQYETDRKETKTIGMIEPSLDSLASAVGQQNSAAFKTSFIGLTNACNNCHRTNEFEFNVVKIPGTQTFSNQDFTTSDSNFIQH